MCAHLLYQITNTNAFKSLGSVSFVFPVKLFPSKSTLTGRYSLFGSSPWRDGSTCLGQDLVACKWAPGVIWETSRHLRWADTYHVGRYRLRGTLPRKQLKGRRVTTWSPQGGPEAAPGSRCSLRGAGCSGRDTSQSPLCQPGPHGRLGDATAPQAMPGTNGSPTTSRR